MTTHDLFRCIGDLSDEFIEEAAEIKRKNRWLPIAALAACAVLAISIPLVLHGGQKSASTAAPLSSAPQRMRPSVKTRLRRMHPLPVQKAKATAAGTTAIRQRRAFWRRRSAACGWG